MKNPRPVFAERMNSLYWLMGYNAAERGLSPRDRFKAERHNEQFRWGYFTYIAETEEIL